MSLFLLQVEVSVAKEKPKGKESVDTLPANVEEWAQYDCPNEIRDTFKQKANIYGINWDNFPKPVSILLKVLEHVLFGRKSRNGCILVFLSVYVRTAVPNAFVL